MEQIQLKEVSKQFHKVPILQDVNLIVQENDILGIIGKSGSGKTTLLNIISGLVYPTNGEVEYYTTRTSLPKNLHKEFSKIKRYIGYMPQHTSFYPKLTVKENLMHFGKLYGLSKETLKNNAKNLLYFTNLYKHENKRAEFLSGGQKKRLDLSCALIHKPHLLILDEPTSDLDPILQKEIMQLIKAVNKQGVTIVIASHHLDDMEDICSKLAIITNGRLHSYGEMEDMRKPFMEKDMTITIKTGKDKEQLLQFIKRLPVKKIIDQGNQIIIYPQDPNQTIAMLLTLVKKERLSFHNLGLNKPTLTEIFTKISQDK